MVYRMDSVTVGFLPQQHGASSGCGRRNGLQYNNNNNNNNIY